MDEPNARSLDLAAVPLLVVAAIFTGWVDLHSNEVQPTVALLILFTGLLSFARPRRPWRWALLMGAAVPLAYAVGPLMGVVARAQPEPNLAATLIALIPALIGAYAGVALRALAAFG